MTSDEEQGRKKKPAKPATEERAVPPHPPEPLVKYVKPGTVVTAPPRTPIPWQPPPPKKTKGQSEEERIA